MEKNKIYIDHNLFMELVDELATQITQMNYGQETYAPSNEVGKQNEMVMQEEAHEYYVEMYDEYENLLNNLTNIYPKKL